MLTTWLNFPVGIALYPIEPLNQFFAVALPFVPLVLLSNVLSLLNLFFTGLATWWLGMLVTGNRWGAWAAGTLFSVSSSVGYFMTVGAAELTHLWLLPLVIGWQIRMGRKPTRRHALFSVCLLVLAVGACFYIGFAALLATLVLALFQVVFSENRVAVRLRYLEVLAVSFVLVLPVLLVFKGSYGAVADAAQATRVLEPPWARVDLTHLFLRSLPSENPLFSAYGCGRFIGFVLPLLAAFGAWRGGKAARVWAVLFGVGLICAMGSFLTVGSTIELSGGEMVWLPMIFVNRMLDTLLFPLHFPDRVFILATLALCVLAAFVIRDRRWAVGVLLVAVEINSAPVVDWPWPRFRLETMDELGVLADQPGSAIADLSTTIEPSSEHRRLSLAAQMSHRLPTNIVPIERLEYAGREGFLSVYALSITAAVRQLMGDHDLRRPPANYRSDWVLLRTMGFDKVVVYRPGGADVRSEKIQSLMTRVLGPAIAQSQRASVYAVPQAVLVSDAASPDEVAAQVAASVADPSLKAVSYRQSELEQWQKDHEEKVDTLKRTRPELIRLAPESDRVETHTPENSL